MCFRARVQAATESLSKENIDLKAEYDETETRLQEIRREIDSQRNILDEAKRRTQIFNEAVEVVKSFFREDYDTEILQGLKTALNNLAVKGQPKTSIKRLLEGLGNVRELAKLEAAIEEKKVELAKTEGELNNARANAGMKKRSADWKRKYPSEKICEYSTTDPNTG